MRKYYKYILAVLVLLGIGSYGVSVASRRPPQSPPPVQSDCDISLWNHVYHPDRLQVIEQCKTVTGVIYSIRPEPDGDLHIRLTPDDPSVINSVNVSKQLGKLILELICDHAVTQPGAVSACVDFHSKLVIPPVGTHVKAIGSHVKDLDHGGWLELHPVTSIEIIK